MKHPVKTTLVLIQLYFLIKQNFEKMNVKNWKTTLFGTLSAVCLSLCTVFPEYKEILASAGGLFGALFAAFSKDHNVTGGTISQTAKTMLLLITLSFTSAFVNAQGTPGTISYNGTSAPTSTNGNLLISNNGLVSEVSGVNYNQSTGVLLLDSVAMITQGVSVTLDTTSTDTARLSVGTTAYINLSNGTTHTVVVVLPVNTVPNAEISFKLSGNVSVLKILKQVGKGASEAYTQLWSVAYTAPNQYVFKYNGSAASWQ